MKVWYLEYEIHKNRLGLLGDISSLLGMLSINIITINGVDKKRRSMLIKCENDDQIVRLRRILDMFEHITVIKIREPELHDQLAIKHGHYLEEDENDSNTFRFVRNEIGILVDFMAEIFKKEGHVLVGIRGMPRVGKTETVVAASVCANKRWMFISSTFVRQTIRSRLDSNERTENFIYIIDGIVSTMRATEKHRELLDELMKLPVVKVIEHPDIFVRETDYTLDDFHYIIELRNDANEEITYDVIESGFSSFDIS